MTSALTRELTHPPAAEKSDRAANEKGKRLKQFELADHVRVEGADLRHSLLTIALKREVPELMKPRKIEISVASANEPRRLETDRQVA